MNQLYLTFFCAISSLLYAHSSEDGVIPVYTNLAQFPLDDDKRLIQHQLVILNYPKCEAEYSEERWFIFFLALFNNLVEIFLLHIHSVGYLPFRDRVKVSGELAYQFFGLNVTEGTFRWLDSNAEAIFRCWVLGAPYSGPCPAVCLERGTHVNYLLHPLPYLVNENGGDIRSFVSHSCQQVEVGFINYAENNAIIYFVSDGNKGKIHLRTIYY